MKSIDWRVPFAAVALTLATSAANAGLIEFEFSFSNVEGTIPGTVTGTLLLPEGDGTFAAASMIITSAPAELEYSLPVMLSDVAMIVTNTFTVNDGMIDLAASEFGATNGARTTGFALNYPDIGTGLTAPGAGLSFDVGVHDADSSTLRYVAPSPGNGPVLPLPATLSLVLAGLVGLRLGRHTLTRRGA